MKHGKRFSELQSKVDKEKRYLIKDAIELLKSMPNAKFDETVELSSNLNVDPRHADQIVRGTLVLPHGTGKSIKVLVLAKGEKEKEATDAGADYVGNEEYIKKIQEGWLDFDKVVATPDMMGQVGKLGRILGPRGLMPSPKSGTVTFEVAAAIKELKAGRIEFRVDKTGNVNVAVGKKSFEKEMLYENSVTFLKTLVQARPAAVKGTYLKNVVLSSTMGVGIKLDLQEMLTFPSQFV